MIGRRRFLIAGASCAATAIAAAHPAPSHSGAPATVPPAEGVLSVQPGRVFKLTGDQDRLKLDRWLFMLVLQLPEPRKVKLDALAISYLSDGEVRRVTTYGPSVLAGLDLVAAVPATPARPSYPVAAFAIADAMAGAFAIDAAHCELAWRTAAGAARRATLDLPIDVATLRTALVFPFEGRGMITQGRAWNDGHRNRSGMFAIDAIGLTDDHALMVGKGDAPAATAGWGRTIIAPAAGTIAVVRGDRPDQPVTGVSDPAYFAREFPQGGDPGNHCVIDHGNGESSLVAHMQSGSVRVREGERVRQGQPLGRLGNSGDSNSPHVHHQLQAGNDWTRADALPHLYLNGPQSRLDRGEIFNALPA